MQWSISDTWIEPHLGAWISSLVADAAAPSDATAGGGVLAVAFGPPGPDGGPAAQAGRAPRGINLHLLSVAPSERAPARLERRTELRLALRYLATSWAEVRADADALLCALAIRLLGRGADGPDGRSEVVVETAPPPLEVLAALGVPPRPALSISLSLDHVEIAAARPRVVQPVVRSGPAAALRGRLLGPGEVPIAAAQVELPSLGRSAETDPAGYFQIVGVPAELQDRVVRVRARGVDHTFRLPASGDGGPLTLRLGFAEEG